MIRLFLLMVVIAMHAQRAYGPDRRRTPSPGPPPGTYPTYDRYVPPRPNAFSRDPYANSYRPGFEPWDPDRPFVRNTLSPDRYRPPRYVEGESWGRSAWRPTEQIPWVERRPPPPKQEFDGPAPSDAQLTKQKLLAEKARAVVKLGERRGGKKEFIALRDAVEAWNMADTEAWKFVRAFNARRQVEREKWEAEENKFLDKGMFGRWND